jgi:hypothetical protein
MSINVPMWFAVSFAICVALTSVLEVANSILKRKIRKIESDIARMRIVYVPVKGGVTGDAYAVKTQCDGCRQEVCITVVNSLGGRSAS